ncbi:MAG: tRNA (adenosine(37)-N6)-dimethylallyltransferase MiaA [Verrucomicrobiota bacterium]|jgi:tRNA dimethylallyltransferase
MTCPSFPLSASPSAASDLLLLAGPTGVGKSAVAIELAERLGGEIVSVDSMQVYRGLDIGTAKPSAEQRARAPHHLIDVVEVSQPFDAARFARLAGEAVAGIRARGRVPILCGGTGLYYRALLEGLGEAPPGDAALRVALGATPLPELLRELAERDPVTYERIDRQNPRRVIRALEVVRLTGRPFSEQRAPWDRRLQTAGRRCLLLGLQRAAGDLRRRIDAQVQEMFRRGLVAETQRLLQEGLGQNPTAMQALGYRQVAEYLDGRRSLADTVELVQIRTRQFAKRQMTWFRRQMQLRWILLEGDPGTEGVVEQVAGAWERPSAGA